MMKFVLLATMLVAMTNAFLPINVGGYIDKPELVADQFVAALTSFAAEKIAEGQNLFLKNLKVVKVQTQLVAGMNYKIEFVAEPVDGVEGQTTRCEVVIYVRFDSLKNLAQAQCQTS